MLFPISDDDRTLDGPAWITILVLLCNLFVFFYFQGAGANEMFTVGWSVIPLEITSGRDLVGQQVIQAQGQEIAIPQAPGPTPLLLTLLSALFMHAGYMHLLGNMLYLWIFGDNIEHRLGSFPFLVFYLVSGLVATLVQVALEPQGVIPILGASGAISGILGAYLVLFPGNTVRVVFFFQIISLPAILVLGSWIVFQLIGGYASMSSVDDAIGGVAYGAHIGGFVTGVLMGLWIRLTRKKKPHPRDRRWG